MYAHPLRSTCFQDLNCVVPQALKPLALLLPLALTFPLAAVVCSLRFFFSFSCVRHFPRPPLLFSFNSTGANHNADSDNIGQSLCRFNQTHLLRRGQGDSDQIRLLVYWRRRKEGRKTKRQKLTNPTGRCQTRPAGCCPSGPGCGRGPAAGRCGGPGRAECRHGSRRLPSWGPIGGPGRRAWGKPGRLRLKNKHTTVKKQLINC